MDNNISSLSALFFNLPCLFALIAGILCGLSINFKKMYLRVMMFMVMILAGLLARQLSLASGDALKEFLPLLAAYSLFSLLTLLISNKVVVKSKRPSGSGQMS